jgi:hypothetical protein
MAHFPNQSSKYVALLQPISLGDASRVDVTNDDSIFLLSSIKGLDISTTCIMRKKPYQNSYMTGY